LRALQAIPGQLRWPARPCQRTRAAVSVHGDRKLGVDRAARIRGKTTQHRVAGIEEAARRADVTGRRLLHEGGVRERLGHRAQRPRHGVEGFSDFHLDPRSRRAIVGTENDPLQQASARPARCGDGRSDQQDACKSRPRNGRSLAIVRETHWESLYGGGRESRVVGRES
jgi:hypothetical protein